jgi:diadenosine tetraphosphatase ApaH/serine/threonine PP2A family protein phosphatase
VIWKPRRRSRSVAVPRAPEGIRVYAIGDIHGRVDLLTQTFARIDADRKTLAAEKALHVFLGDYVDRGPSSREVLDALIARGRRHPAVYLKGNHESYFLEFMHDPEILDTWRLYGGLNTLLSYGLTPSIIPDRQESAALASGLRAKLPKSHLRFLSGLKPSFTCGDYFFVHAGVRPGVSLSHQQEEDLLWIRDEFLLHEEAYGKVVVHGHTPVVEPDIRSNRINIDTGAYATGRLTCLVLDDDERRFI